MKNLVLIPLVFVMSFGASSQDFHRLFVNRMWQVTTGLPQEVNHSASLVDPSGNLYIAGNQLTLFNGTDLVVRKFNSSGVLQWSYSYNGSTNGNDYATALTRDSDGNIIVAGTVQNVSVGDYDYVTLKLTSGGTLSWSALFNGAAGGNDGATSVVTDSSKNIYVTGASEGSGTSYDYCTLKYSPSGTFQWESRYNYSNGYDAAALVTVGPTYVYVTGASGSAWNNWDIATLRYNHSGTFISEYRVSASAQGYSEPFDMTTDASGKLYVTGKVSSDSSGFNIKTMKLDSDLDLVWAVEWDGAGLDDEGRGIDIDASGNVYVTGTSKKNGQGSKMVTLKYNASGTEQWVREMHTVPVGLDAKGRKVRFDDERGLAIVCGEKQRASGSETVLAAYAADGQLRMMEHFRTQTGVYHACHSLNLSGGSVYVHGIADSSGSKSYFGVRYQLYQKESFIDTNANGSMVRNDLIVSFNPAIIDISKTNKDKDVFFAMEDIFPDSVIDCFNARTGIDFSRLIVTKIFPENHSWDSVSISRLGEEVHIPPFYATLLVRLPVNVNDSLIRDSLLLCNEYIRFAEFNRIITLSDCTPNDPNFAAGNQAGLWPTSTNEDAHMNVAEAWCYASGQPEIRVGVFDTGIRWNHEDLHDSPGSDSYVGSDVAGGFGIPFGFSNPPVPIEEYGQVPTSAHGTIIAGIIAGRRDNELGIAGIAGRSPDGEGVTLFDMKNSIYPGLEDVVILDNALRALYIGACQLGEENPFDPEWGEELPFPDPSLGLHVINISYQIVGADISFRQVMEFAFKNGVCVSVSSGNLPNAQSLESLNIDTYPASFKDEWVIKVGSSNASGEHSGSFSMYGSKMDFIAPGENTEYQSLMHDNTSGYTPTTANTDYWGTSFAAPHVAGICALMLSYVNTHPDAPNPITGEDAENIMQSNVGGVNPHYFDVGVNGYDAITGYGRPNAGKIVERLQLPCYKVRHFEKWVTPAQVWTLDADSLDIYVTYHGSALAQPLPPPSPGTPYEANRYKVTLVNGHSIGSETLLEGWKRDGQSDFAPLMDTFPGPGTEVSLDSYSATSATLTGYVYEIFANGQTYWWPCNPYIPNRFAYTLYTFDGESEVCNPSTSVNESLETTIQLFPNPATDYVEIRSSKFLTGDEIFIFDATGKMVMRQKAFGFSTNIDVRGLATGLYALSLTTDLDTKTFKLIKQ